MSDLHLQGAINILTVSEQVFHIYVMILIFRTVQVVVKQYPVLQLGPAHLMIQ